MPRPILATIDHAALRANYALAKRALPAKAWAVVKANAYGHGLSRVARALRAEADGFALLDLAEAVLLRELGITQPILLLEGFFDAGDLELVIAHRLSLVVHCRTQIEMLKARGMLGSVPLYIKFNSGMNRLGFPLADAGWLRAELASCARGQVTLMTHFADADGGTGVDWQLARLADIRAAWAAPWSLANSASILRHPKVGGDWMRPGILLYGGSPFGSADPQWSAERLGLLPAMTLESRLLSVQEIKAGDSVGYGCGFRAASAMRIGVVACGYADGYPRQAPSGTPVLVDGVRTRLVGRVSMDMLTVDLTPVPQALPGTLVTLWGKGLAADEVAAAAGTISYELFCALAARVPVVEVNQKA